MQAITILRKNLFISLCTIASLSLAGTLIAQTNYAISMDGTSSSYADLGTVSPTGNFSTGLTIECWIKWGGFGSWARLLDLGNGGSSDNILFATENTSNNLRFEVYEGGSTQGLSGPANLVTGRWYHVAVTEDGSGNTTLYVDGAVVATGTVWLPNDVSRANCYIGKSNFAGDAYLNGSIDEMRIWNVVRTQQQLKSYMFKRVDAATAGLVAYYHCDENSGTTFTNSTSGAGAANGTAASGLAWVASPIQFAANALNFDGSNDYGVIPNTVSSDFTVEYWMKTTATGGGNSGSQWYNGNGIVDAEVGGVANDWGTSLVGQKLVFGIGNPDKTIFSTSAVNTGNWVHVAVTWKQSSGAMQLYINGVLEASGTGGTALRSSPSRIMLGELQTSIQPFPGTIDELRIWNMVRTQAQIQASMNTELDPTSAAATGLVAYYTFDQNIAAGTNTGVVTVIDQKGTNNGTLNNFALTGSTSNFISQNNSLIVLPVQLVSFTANRVNAGIELNWQTSSEQNSRDFTVERSADGHSWTNLALLPAAGNSSTGQRYRYLDASPLAGNNFYRLLQSDLDGRTSYSPVVRVAAADHTRSFSLSSTNLSNGLLQVMVNEPVMLRLFSIDGKLLWSKALSPGYQSIPLQMASKGIYILKGGNTTEKLYTE